MDFDMNVRLTRSGEITQELIVLPDANISAPVTDIDDDLPLWLKKQHLVVPVFCENQLNISAIISIYYFLKLIVEQPHYVYATHCIWNSQIIESELETFLRSMVFFSMSWYSMYCSTEL
ncbi:hypothetical protein T03_15758 [Trichinella britovi]|uniref:Uncharacterized protein n=1 Tax=Trichinella britovi TaxID=45882 RepID=A0A0V1CBS6_TRIBR|nr:hypothetical protein T03_15758 [Trichinella britovi]